MVESTAITKGCPVPMVSPTIMAYPLIVVDLKTSMTMPSPAIPTTPTTPPTTVRPTIMVEPTTPHPSSRIPPVALSSPTIPMVRTTLMMSTTTVAGDIMGGPTNTGSPTTMVGFTTTVRFPTIVGFITKVSLTTTETCPTLVALPSIGRPITMAGTISMKPITTEGLPPRGPTAMTGTCTATVPSTTTESTSTAHILVITSSEITAMGSTVVVAPNSLAHTRPTAWPQPPSPLPILVK